MSYWWHAINLLLQMTSTISPRELIALKSWMTGSSLELGNYKTLLIGICLNLCDDLPVTFIYVCILASLNNTVCLVSGQFSIATGQPMHLFLIYSYLYLRDHKSHNSHQHQGIWNYIIIMINWADIIWCCSCRSCRQLWHVHAYACGSSDIHYVFLINVAASGLHAILHLPYTVFFFLFSSLLLNFLCRLLL